MEKHLLISKGCGLGRAADLSRQVREKIAYITWDPSPVVDHLSERPAGLPLMYSEWRTAGGKGGLMVIDCGGTLRCGLYPKRGIPTINLHPTGKSGPLAEFIHEGIYVSA